MDLVNIELTENVKFVYEMAEYTSYSILKILSSVVLYHTGTCHPTLKRKNT